MERTDILLYGYDSFFPRRSLYVFVCLTDSFRININGCNVTVIASLSHHQGNQSGSCADVQYAMRVTEINPSTQQYSVGAYFHGASVMMDSKLLECEKWIRHISLYFAANLHIFR
jgi:hypothetical protein